MAPTPTRKSAARKSKPASTNGNGTKGARKANGDGNGRGGGREPVTPDYEVAIIGAGFGGIGAGVELKRAGIDNFIIVDKHSDIGGTWHANTYPGVAVDIPSVYYSFSYEPAKYVSRVFAPGHEVKAYADQVVDKYGLRPHIRLNTTITSGQWDEDNHIWRGTVDTGEEFTSRFVIGAVGGLEVPKMPDIEGVDDYAGKVVHTARWDHEYDYEGKRIAVIGTGATALQLIPEMAKVASRLTVFQRTPIWAAPKPDFEIPPLVNQVINTVPGLRRVLRGAVTVAIDMGISTAGVFHSRIPFVMEGVSQAARRMYRYQLRDAPELADKLTPDYTIGCKRPSVSNSYLRTFTKDHVELVTDPIARITPTGVVTEDGREHEIDVLICATGFEVMGKGTTPPYPLRGRGGIDLNDFWDKNRFQAYQGVSVPNFPNMFLITGPYGFAAGSYIAMIECTAAHASRAIKEAHRRHATYVEVTQEAHDRYYEMCQKRQKETLWFSPGCADSNTYYINYQGDAAAIRPTTHAGMWWGNRRFPHSDYSYDALRYRARRAVAPAAEPVTA